LLPGTRRQTAAIVFNNQHQPFILLPALQGDRAGISMFHNVVQPFLATIMLSVHDSPALVEQALNAGARGFLSKRCSPDELIAAVHTVATGGCYLTPDIAIKLASGRQDPLTKRERQVAEKLAQGMAVKEIAAELGLSPKTVHVHRANLMEKLGVSNDVELARRMFDGW
jgi:two-component system, NarL family, uhpT operon response regulator UhpA